MKLRNLGKSDLDIARIGMGSWAIGGGQWEFGWGAQDDQKSIDAIHAGLDLGSIGSTQQLCTASDIRKK